MELYLAFGTFLGAWVASRWSVKKGRSCNSLALLISVSLMSIKLWFFNKLIVL